MLLFLLRACTRVRHRVNKPYGMCTVRTHKENLAAPLLHDSSRAEDIRTVAVQYCMSVSIDKNTVHRVVHCMQSYST